MVMLSDLVVHPLGRIDHRQADCWIHWHPHTRQMMYEIEKADRINIWWNNWFRIDVTIDMNDFYMMNHHHHIHHNYRFFSLIPIEDHSQRSVWHENRCVIWRKKILKPKKKNLTKHLPATHTSNESGVHLVPSVINGDSLATKFNLFALQVRLHGSVGSINANHS